MSRTLYGRLHGRVIELDEDIGADDGAAVEVQLRVLAPAPSEHAQVSEGMAKVYEILGERYDSGCINLAERHNEHQP